MEKYKFYLNIEGSPKESTLTRLKMDNCTMLGGKPPKNVYWERSNLNLMIKKCYEITENLQEGGNVKDLRFVEGEKILFSKIFKEKLEEYNRKQNRKDRYQDVDTYYDKLDARRQKSDLKYKNEKDPDKKVIARKNLFHISRDIQITIGDERNYPNKQQMDMFGYKFTEWFESCFPQMPVFMSVITYDDCKHRVINKKTCRIVQPPTLHICVLTIAKNSPESKRKKDWDIGWNRCLQQSLNYEGKSAFLEFRNVILKNADRIAKECGFCNKRPKEYSNAEQ